MGAKSTVYITRQEALDFVSAHINQVSSLALEEVLELINDNLYANKNYEHGFGLASFIIEQNSKEPWKDAVYFDGW